MMKPKSVPSPWREPIATWTVALRSAGRSPNTIATRTDHLRRAARALGGSPWTVTADQVTEWVGRQEWGRETRRSVYATLRLFWSWAVATGRCEVSPAATLPAVQPEPPMPRPTPERVYRDALAAADGRERLILRLAAESGLRRAEIAQVHRRDVLEDLTGWSLLVHGKGGRDRIVPVDDELAVLVRAAVMASGGWMLPGDDHGHLSPRYVGILASRLLPEDWTLHTLRHRCASVAYSAERDLLGVQQLLGHASVATTQRYVRVPDTAIRRAVAAAAA